MNRIITISREFGSGGREVGKRLAEALGIAYYDKEIITAIAEHSGLAEEYVQNILENKLTIYYPITYGRSFVSPYFFQDNLTKIMMSQHDILQDLAGKSDCVIVGRCSDSILAAKKPLKLFIYADMASKIKRCRAKAPEGEDLSDKELEKQINKMNKGRASYQKLFTDNKWGEKENYNLCINTSGLVIKEIIPPLVDFANHWFGSAAR